VIVAFLILPPIKPTCRRTPHFIEYLRHARHGNTHPVLPLVSRRNFWGMYDTIKFPEINVFNPSLLSLPILQNSSAEYVAVAREEYLVINLENGKDAQPRELVGGLLEDTRDHTRYSPTRNRDLRGNKITYLEKLINSEDVVFPKCEGYWYINIQGPEDGRLFWSKLGEPLLIYLSVSPDNISQCRTLYIIDLRIAYAPLRKLLPDPPIRFPRSIPLVYHNQTGFPKNWAVFTNAFGQVFVHTDLVPQRIFELMIPDSEEDFPNFSSPASDLSLLEPLPTTTYDRNCVSRILGDTEVPYSIELHQSSPLLDVVLCTTGDVKSGKCDETDPQNRIYIMLIQGAHRSRNLYYEPRIVTLNSSSPFNYISFSKPLIYRTTLIDGIDFSGSSKRSSNLHAFYELPQNQTTSIRARTGNWVSGRFVNLVVWIRGRNQSYD
jgi:hypothetical protein